MDSSLDSQINFSDVFHFRALEMRSTVLVDFVNTKNTCCYLSLWICVLYYALSLISLYAYIREMNHYGVIKCSILLRALNV